MLRNSGGTRGETRSSALWGTGNRGSDSRANALWGRGTRGLDLVGGVSAVIDADKLAALAKIRGLTVTPDAQVRLAAYSSQQLWPYESGIAKNWEGTTSASLPTIAVVDSGIEANRADFGNRVLASVNLSTRTPNSPGDGRGHGTFVSGIAAGGAPG